MSISSEAVGGLITLVARTNKAKPEREDVVALRTHLENHPGLWRLIGDLSASTYQKLVEAAAGGQTAVAESLHVGRDAMRGELGYQTASALERLMIDQVVLCWLRLNHTEQRYTAAFEGTVKIPIPVADYWERRLSSSQRRFQRACEGLARIRKLAFPSLQVNIANKQVNLSGSAP